MPKVSVILTSFNHAKYLREAIDSALNQTFTEFELIIWDDASSDDSWEIIQGYQDPRIKAFRNDVQRRGIYGINKAISEVAQGEYIAIHHSDDVWEPEKLEKQAAFLDSHADIGAVFTNALAIDEESAPFKDEGHFYFKIFDQPNRSRHEWLRHFFEKGNALCHPSVLIRKQCYRECGLYRYGFAQVGDFDMWVRLALRYQIHVLPEKLVRFRVRENEANTSGSRPETRSRGLYEYSLILNHYLQINTLDDLVKVFPEALKFCSGDNPNLRYALAMAILEIRPFYFTIQFALNLLLEMLNDPAQRNFVAFDNKDFIKLTGELDPLQVQQREKLNQAVAERDAQIASLSQVVTERDGEIASLTYKLGEAHAGQDNLKDTLAVIYASRSWKVTRPLRYLQRFFRRRKDVAKGLLQVSSRFIKSLRQYGLVGTANRVICRSGLQQRRYSDLLKAPKPYDSRPSRDVRPRKTTLVSMLKNEKNIIEAFAGHVLSMFDRVIFIDHQSTDGTQSYLKHLASVYPQLEVYVFDEEGYYQSEVMTWAVTKLIGAEDDGWVFFLDADEFLPFHSREEFETELGNYAFFPVISMPWLNLVPLEMVGGNVKDERFLKPAKTAIHHKVAFQPSLIPFDEYVIAQGNHALLIGENLRQQFPAEEAFAIYHLPIRTKSQLRDKIRYGVEAYKKMGPDRERGLGVHWDEIDRHITKNGITDELMVDMVVRYGEPLSPPYGKSIVELRNRGYFEIKLDLCVEEALPKFAFSMEAEEIQRSRVDDAQERFFLTSKRGMHIALNAETNTLRFQAD